ncbi:MAG: hypothetical protein ACYDDA_16035 [Acidiferrobacteraceae bacterium]
MPDQAVDSDAQNAGRSYKASYLSTYGRARRLLSCDRSEPMGFGDPRTPSSVRAGGRRPVVNHSLRIAVLVFSAALLGASPYYKNVKPGDRDYPVPNPHPTHTFRIYGTMDPHLNIKFAINWRAADQQCTYWVSVIEGADAPFHVTQLVPTVRHGNHFDVTIPTDGVLPGRCKWRFSGILMYAGKLPDPAYIQPIIATNSPTLRPGASPDSFANFDCHLGHRPSLFGNASSSIPCTDRDDTQGALWWYPQTRSVEMNFYER